jgi:hypothetical protein
MEKSVRLSCRRKETRGAVWGEKSGARSFLKRPEVSPAAKQRPFHRLNHFECVKIPFIVVFGLS